MGQYKSRHGSTIHKTSIGGQALIEGIMMRGPKKTAMAVRNPKGEIQLEFMPTSSVKEKLAFLKLPVLRGIVNFVESLILGYKCLMRSAEISGLDLEDEEPESKLDKWICDHLGEKLMPVISVISTVIGVALALFLFMGIPAWIIGFVSDNLFTPPQFVKALFEGIIKIVIFILYMYATSKIPDIKRMYKYHGAEHKTIACYEDGAELTVDNIKNYTRFHPRCGTSFIFVVLIVSIFANSLIPVWTWYVRVPIKLLVLPLVVGIAYEFIKLAGKYDNPVTRALSAPGMSLQHITTNEPDPEMIECAIEAMNAVIPENPDEDKW